MADEEEQKSESAPAPAETKPETPDWLREALNKTGELVKSQNERLRAAEGTAQAALEIARRSSAPPPPPPPEPEEDLPPEVLTARKVAREEIEAFKRQATEVLQADRHVLVAREAARAEREFFQSHAKAYSVEVQEAVREEMGRWPPEYKQDYTVFQAVADRVEGQMSRLKREAEAARPPATGASGARKSEEAEADTKPRLSESEKDAYRRLFGREPSDEVYSTLRGKREVSIEDYKRARATKAAAGGKK